MNYQDLKPEQKSELLSLVRIEDPSKIQIPVTIPFEIAKFFDGDLQAQVEAVLKAHIDKYS